MLRITYRQTTDARVTVKFNWFCKIEFFLKNFILSKKKGHLCLLRRLLKKNWFLSWQEWLILISANLILMKGNEIFIISFFLILITFLSFHYLASTVEWEKSKKSVRIMYMPVLENDQYFLFEFCLNESLRIKIYEKLCWN